MLGKWALHELILLELCIENEIVWPHIRFLPEG
jgi:hypothetical protein